MTHRVSPSASADVPAGVSADIPAETSAHGQATPQVSGEIYLPGSGPDSVSEKPASEARLRVFVCHECGSAEPAA